MLFDSLSGNTAKMAELVAEGARTVPDTEVRVRLFSPYGTDAATIASDILVLLSKA